MGPPTTNHRPCVVLTVVAAVCIGLLGCGVSGKASDSAAPGTTAATPRTTSTSEATTGTTTEAPPQTTATTEASTGSTETTLPDTGSGDTTIPTAPDGNDTTVPDSTNPFGTGDIRSTLIRIYKQSGFSDKEARCVADLIVKQSAGGTFDPSKLDVRKLGTAARKCLGTDGLPGGN